MLCHCYPMVCHLVCHCYPIDIATLVVATHQRSNDKDHPSRFKWDSTDKVCVTTLFGDSSVIYI